MTTPGTYRPPVHPQALLCFKRDCGAELIEGIAVPRETLNQAIAHLIGRVPSFYQIIKFSGGNVEHGTTAYTSTNVYISNRGTTAATVSILVFPPFSV